MNKANELNISFIKSLLKFDSLNNFFLSNNFGTNCAICNCIKNYLCKYSKSLDWKMNHFPLNEYLDYVFQKLMEEIRNKNAEIVKLFDFEYKLAYTQLNITRKMPYFKFIITKCKNNKFKLRDYFEYFLKNYETIEIKCGDDIIKKKENNYKFSIIKESNILIFFIQNYSNYKINFEIESKINLFDYKLTNEKISYNLSSYIYGENINKSMIYEKAETVELRNKNFLILLYSLVQINKDSIETKIKKKNITGNFNINNDYNYKYSPKGLINIDGSYCYMNSIIQCLFYLNEFRDKIRNKNYNVNQPISLAFQQVVNGLLENNNRAYDPTEFKKIISKYARLFKDPAGDPSDLILYLLDRFHEEDKIEVNYNDIEVDEKIENEVYENCLAGIDKSIVSDLFYGYYGQKAKCSKCNDTFYFIEPKFLMEINVKEISQNYRGKNSIKLEDYFNNYYVRIQDKYFFCPKCGKQIAKIKEYIKKEPKILVLVLKNTDIKFKLEIQENFELNNTTYKLSGISTIAYRPSPNTFGHAIAFCLHNNNYYEISDTQINDVKFEDFKSGEHYVLFYTE